MKEDEQKENGVDLKEGDGLTDLETLYTN